MIIAKRFYHSTNDLWMKSNCGSHNKFNICTIIFHTIFRFWSMKIVYCMQYWRKKQAIGSDFQCQSISKVIKSIEVKGKKFIDWKKQEIQFHLFIWSRSLSCFSTYYHYNIQLLCCCNTSHSFTLTHSLFRFRVMQLTFVLCIIFYLLKGMGNFCICLFNLRSIYVNLFLFFFLFWLGIKYSFIWWENSVWKINHIKFNAGFNVAVFKFSNELFFLKFWLCLNLFS